MCYKLFIHGTGTCTCINFKWSECELSLTFVNGT